MYLLCICLYLANKVLLLLLLLLPVSFSTKTRRSCGLCNRHHSVVCGAFVWLTGDWL